MPQARLEALAAKRARRGLETPMVDEQPELFDDLQLAWDAWDELSDSRTWREGQPLALLHSEIRAWLDLNEIDNGERLDLYKTIKRLDIAWISMRSKHQKKTKRGNPTSSDRGEKRTRR